MLAILLLIGSLGCGKINKQKDDGGDGLPITIGVNTASPEDADSSAPVLEATPTPTADPASSEAFRALDLEIFKWYATSDGFSFLFMAKDPKALGIDPSTVEMTWGDFSEEAFAQNTLEASAFLERLTAIPRAKLSDSEQFAYDVIEQYLESAITDGSYQYYYEPLTKIVGLQANLPLNMALLDVETEQDAVDYIALLNDLPRYFGQMLTYEQGRAERGRFMTEGELDGVLEDCSTIIDSANNSFLYAVFDEAVDALPGVTDARKDELKQANATALKKSFFPAYKTLYNGLKALRGKCRAKVGVCAISEEAKQYYAYGVQTEGDNLLPVEETYELLNDTLMDLLVDISELYAETPDLFERETKITSGDTATDVALLESITAELLPALPEHTVEMQNVPEELEDMLSPAAYVIPPVDEWKNNTALINLSSSDSEYLLTLAHEMYPGHMYHYIYQRALESPSYMQRAIGLSGYSEGWSQLSEDLVIEHQTAYDKAYCTYDGLATRVDTILPALVSILVNYYGYSEEAIKTRMEALFASNAEEMASAYYDLAIEMPYYYMKYAVGYAQIKSLMQDAQDELGDSFDEKAFLKAYLDTGRGQFNLVKERMDIWIDQQLSDADVG